MQTFSLKMTTQRQVTYPKELVKSLDLSPGQTFQIQILDPEEKLTKYISVHEFISSVREAAATYEGKPISKKQYRKEMAEYYQQKDEQLMKELAEES
ncbi:MAG: hypothetical protein ABI425_03345 [Patescibacteria group bacterium]